MGRRSVTSYDDVLLRKLRLVIQKVLDTVNADGELEHVDSLYAPNTLAVLSGAGEHGPSSSQSARRPPYTFEHFAEHLDVEDNTFQNLIELLVTLTARKAIAKAAQEKDEELTAQVRQQEALSSSSTTISPALEQGAVMASLRAERASARTSRECQRGLLRNRALQGEIRGLTRRNRRSRRTDDSDSSSNDSINIRSPPPTRTVFSSLVDPSSFPSLQGVLANNDADGATTRAARVGQGSTTYRWLQRDLTSMRRRIVSDVTQRRVDGSDRPQQPELSNVRSSSTNDDRFQMEVSNDDALPARDPYDSLVRHFLSQPFQSEARRQNEEPVISDPTPTLSVTADQLQDSTGLQATLAPTIDAARTRSHSPELYTHPAVSLDPLGVEMRSEADLGTAGHGRRNSTRSRLDDVRAIRAIRAAYDRLPRGDPSSSPTLTTPSPPSRTITDRTGEFEAFAARRRQGQRLRQEERTGTDERRQGAEGQASDTRLHAGIGGSLLAHETSFDETSTGTSDPPGMGDGEDPFAHLRAPWQPNPNDPIHPPHYPPPSAMPRSSSASRHRTIINLRTRPSRRFRQEPPAPPHEEQSGSSVQGQ